MTFSEFKELPKVKAIIEEILSHDTTDIIVSIGLPAYHLTPEHNITTGDGGIDIFIFTKKHSTDDELSDFIYDRDLEMRTAEALFSLYEETYHEIDNTHCYPLYTAPTEEKPDHCNCFNPEDFM